MSMWCRAAVTLALAAAAIAPAAGQVPQLHRDPRMVGPVPVPAAERDIPTVVAERWFTVSATPTTLEGATFDDQGNLLLCDVGGNRVLRVTPAKRMTVLLDQPGLGVGGLAVRADGRIFAAAASDMKRGSLGVIDAATKRFHATLLTGGDYVPNDLVFDSRGGYYFTDFKGSAVDPTGGVYHVDADGRTVTPIVQHLARGNGVALSPDGRTLWVTEHGRNRLLRITLTGAGTIAERGLAVAYQFIGPAPDSMRTDAQGNVYVALTGQGRVLILSPGGIPMGQVLLPGREQGHNLKSTSLALKPGTDEMYIVSSDDSGTMGAAVYRARTFVTAP